MSRKKSISFLEKVKGIYENQYKKLLIIPILMLVLAVIQIGSQVAMTGDFIHKGVSLKGGISLSVNTEEDVNLDSVKKAILDSLPNADINMKTLSSAGSKIGFVVEADIAVDSKESIDKLYSAVESGAGVKLDGTNSNLEGIGSNLGASFFKDTVVAVMIAFLLMGIVVFFYFRSLIPSSAVILAAASDIIVTIAIVNVFGMKISTAGIAAFLMMIGYSVDTDILLSVRVLKKKEGSVLDRVYSAMKTGITMNVTTMVAISIALFVAHSEVLKQIMTILLIGLFVDMINTWIQNAGILRLYLEKKESSRRTKK